MAFSFWKKMFGTADGENAEAVNVPQAEDVLTKDESSAIEQAVSGQDADAVVSCDAADAVETVLVDKSGLESFVSYVAKSLVDNPDAVSIATVEKERLSVIQIRCEKKDIGKLIGKNGKTIAAIRLLVSGAGGRMGLRMTVDVLD